MIDVQLRFLCNSPLAVVRQSYARRSTAASLQRLLLGLASAAARELVTRGLRCRQLAVLVRNVVGLEEERPRGVEPGGEVRRPVGLDGLEGLLEDAPERVDVPLGLLPEEVPRIGIAVCDHGALAQLDELGAGDRELALEVLGPLSRLRVVDERGPEAGLTRQRGLELEPELVA